MIHSPRKKLCLFASLIVSLLLASAAYGAVHFSVINLFQTNAALPYCSLDQAKSGDFYGTSLSGVNGRYGNGTVFRMTDGGRIKIIGSLNYTNGSECLGNVALPQNGFIYATTQFGGTYGAGTLFKVPVGGGKIISLFSFDATNGGGPNGLTLGYDGNLYGLTAFGGGGSSENRGTLYRSTLDGQVTVLGVFCGTNGAITYDLPPHHLAQDVFGNFYGTTRIGGYTATNFEGFGTVFKFTSDGTLTTLFNFDGTNGDHPNGLTIGEDGNLYGTTTYGGAYSNGTVFRLTTNGELTTLHSFSALFSTNSDGAHPSTELVLGKDGSFYGMTGDGGKTLGDYGGIGAVFRISTNGDFFPVCSLGMFTNAYMRPCAPIGLAEDSRGNLYGTTLQGGNIGSYGTVFKLKKIRPVITINKKQLNGSDAILNGRTKAKENTPVINVFWKLNESGWKSADTGNNWVNWTANVTLNAGTNVFYAYSIDATGDVSHTNVVKLHPEPNDKP
jgi:uncharacterized repeat protein (TIGR03803 family)